MVSTTPDAGTPLHDSPGSQARNTLAIDIGGTGLKASVLDDDGHMEHDRVRIDTPYPLSPDKLVTVLTDLVKGLPPYDRISVGFPGMVRGGRILSAPHFISPEGPEGKPSTEAHQGVGRLRPAGRHQLVDAQADQGGQRRRHPGLGGGHR